MNDTVLNAGDVIRGSAGKVYGIIGEDRYLLMHVKNIEAKGEVNIAEVKRVGTNEVGYKPTTITYDGSMTVYYCSPLFRNMLNDFKKTGKAVYFDLHLINDDQTSNAGRRSTFLKGCLLKNFTVAKIDADSDFLEEEADFVYTTYESDEDFKLLEGTQQ